MYLYKPLKKKEAELIEKQNELSGLKVQQAHLAAKPPENTQEEMEERIIEAESEYESILIKADAIQEVYDAFNKLREEKDSQTLDPWLSELGRVLAPLTAGRYTKVNLTNDHLAIRTDGSEMPFKLLSAGTKVGLGLAIRLSMARYFLEGLDGFLIMDDPLVDMDPERQKTAAKIIQDFSRDKQILIATCHPSHADLLGGHKITL